MDTGAANDTTTKPATTEAAKRPLAEPSPVAGRVPVVFSDRTCKAIWDVEWRTMRIFLDECGIKISHIGRRPIVRIDAVLRALDGEDSSDWDEEAAILRAAKGGR